MPARLNKSKVPAPYHTEAELGKQLHNERLLAKVTAYAGSEELKAARRHIVENINSDIRELKEYRNNEELLADLRYLEETRRAATEYENRPIERVEVPPAVPVEDDGPVALRTRHARAKEESAQSTDKVDSVDDRGEPYPSLSRQSSSLDKSFRYAPIAAKPVKWVDELTPEDLAAMGDHRDWVEAGSVAVKDVFDPKPDTNVAGEADSAVDAESVGGADPERALILASAANLADSGTDLTSTTKPAAPNMSFTLPNGKESMIPRPTPPLPPNYPKLDDSIIPNRRLVHGTWAKQPFRHALGHNYAGPMPQVYGGPVPANYTDPAVPQSRFRIPADIPMPDGWDEGRPRPSQPTAAFPDAEFSSPSIPTYTHGMPVGPPHPRIPNLEPESTIMAIEGVPPVKTRITRSLKPGTPMSAQETPPTPGKLKGVLTTVAKPVIDIAQAIPRPTFTSRKKRCYTCDKNKKKCDLKRPCGFCEAHNKTCRYPGEIDIEGLRAEMEEEEAQKEPEAGQASKVNYPRSEYSSSQTDCGDGDSEEFTFIAMSADRAIPPPLSVDGDHYRRSVNLVDNEISDFVSPVGFVHPRRPFSRSGRVDEDKEPPRKRLKLMHPRNQDPHRINYHDHESNNIAGQTQDFVTGDSGSEDEYFMSGALGDTPNGGTDPTLLDSKMASGIATRPTRRGTTFVASGDASPSREGFDLSRYRSNRNSTGTSNPSETTTERPHDDGDQSEQDAEGELDEEADRQSPSAGGASGAPGGDDEGSDDSDSSTLSGPPDEDDEPPQTAGPRDDPRIRASRAQLAAGVVAVDTEGASDYRVRRNNKESRTCDHERPCQNCQDAGRAGQCLYDGDDEDEDRHQLDKDLVPDQNRGRTSEERRAEREARATREKKEQKDSGSQGKKRKQNDDNAAKDALFSPPPFSSLTLSSPVANSSTSQRPKKGLVPQAPVKPEPDPSSSRRHIMQPAYHQQDEANNRTADPQRLYLSSGVDPGSLTAREARSLAGNLEKSFVNYLEIAIRENEERLGKAKKGTFDYQTQSILRIVYGDVEFPRTNLLGASPDEVELHVCNSADADDLLGTEATTDIPLLIHGAQIFKFQKDKDKRGSNIMQFLETFGGDDVIQVQNPGLAKAGDSVVSEITVKTFKDRLTSRNRRLHPYNALDLPIKYGNAQFVVPTFIAGQPNAHLLSDIDNHIKSNVKVGSKDVGSSFASRTNAVDRANGIQPFGDKHLIALCAEGGSCTAPHQDAFAYRTWVTLQDGQLMWHWLHQPTEQNLLDVFKATAGLTPMPRGLPWKGVVSKPDWSFTMPPGMVHSVVRTREEHTLLFAGHYVCRSEILKWVDTVMLQWQHPTSHNEDSTVGVQQLVKVLGEILVKVKAGGCSGLKAEHFGGKKVVEEALEKVKAFQNMAAKSEVRM
ncbi:Hypothetical protein D9617_19g102490 [Elsinoe fawcettii]|nr:Hypothetical protein D9617_19g102490 [Elsinoe fawcettii]